MPFFTKHKKIFSKTFLMLFMFCSFMLPALTPHMAIAEGTVDANQIAKDLDGYPTDICSIDTPVGCIALVTYYVLMVPAYLFAALMGVFFNFTLSELVVSMGTVTHGMPGIMIAWTVLRDMANVFLVFITIYIGIATILGISGYGYKQLLWRVVLAALLVNFSSTFTKFVIDVSNITAIETYAMFSHASPQNIDPSCLQSRGDTVTEESIENGCSTHGIAAAFFSQLRVTSLFKDTSQSNTNKSSKYWKMSLMAVLSFVLFAILGFLLLAAGFLLITRFVLLTFLLIVSPVAFVVWITKISSIGRRWWSTLINQSVFAPLLLLFWWIAYTILNSYVSQFSNIRITSDTNTIAPGPGVIAIITMYIIVTGFLIAGLFLAKSLGAHGASTAMNIGEKLSRGTAGFVGAYTLGGMSYAAGTGYIRSMAKAHEKDEEGNIKYHNVFARTARKVSGTKLDRGIQSINSAGANKRFFGTKSLSERNAESSRMYKARKMELDREGSDMSLRKARKILNDPEERLARRHGMETEASKKARKIVARASEGSLERTMNKKSQTKAMMSAYTKKQLNAMAGKATTHEEKAKFKRAAYSKERSAIDTIRSDSAKPEEIEEAKKTIGKMTHSDITENADLFKGNPRAIAYTSHSTRKKVLENEDLHFTDTEIAKFNKETKKHFQNLKGEDLENEMNKMNPSQLATMDKHFLARPEVASNIDARMMNELIKNGLTKEKRNAIEKTVEDRYATIKDKVRKIKKYKKQQETGSSSIIDPKTQKPISPTPPQKLTREEQNILKLYEWFNNDGTFEV